MSNFSFDTDDDVIVNVPNGRCPTLNDLYAEIKRLERNNYQLKVRIFMNEQAQGGKNPNKLDPTSKNELVQEFMCMKKERDELRQKYDALLSVKGDLEITMKDLQLPKENPEKNEAIIDEFNHKITNMTKALVEIGSKFTQLEEEHKRLTEENSNNLKKLNEKDNECKILNEVARAEKMKNEELNLKLKECDEYAEKLNKENEINIVQRAGEKQLKERQLQVQSQQMGNLLADNQILMERLRVSEDALKLLNQEHSKLVIELKALRSGYSNLVLNVANDVPGAHGDEKSDGMRQETSPDLGIESGQDIASVDGNVYAENAMLRDYNRQLVLKLQQTRQQLDKTVTRLSTTTKHNQQVEKAICRQLHKTHSILKEAKLSLEQKQSQQVLTNLLPPSV